MLNVRWRQRFEEKAQAFLEILGLRNYCFDSDVSWRATDSKIQLHVLDQAVAKVFIISIISGPIVILNSPW